MRSIITLFIAAILISSIFGCKTGTKSIPMSDPAHFDGWVSGFTSGVISSESVVQIFLAKSIEGYQPGTELPAGVLTLIPATPGTAVVEDRFTISFKPGKPFRQGLKYVASLDLTKLLEAPADLKRFNFGFEVISQDFTVFEGRLISELPDMETSYRYEGRMITADVMFPEDARKLLEASIAGKKLDIIIESEGLKKFTYVISGIERQASAFTMTVSWRGSPVGVDKKGNFEVKIPSINDFILLSHQVNQTDQSLQLVFSDPLDGSQQIAGLIRFNNLDDVRIARNGALVTLFPNQRLAGEQRVTVEGSVRSSSGKMLGEPVTLLVAMEPLMPQVEIIGKGSIMPDSKGLILPFRAVGLRAVDVAVYKIFADNVKQYFQDNTMMSGWNLRYTGRPVFIQTVRLDKGSDLDLSRWNGFSVDLTEMTRKDPQAIYQVKISFKRSYTWFDCNGQMSSTEEIGQSEISSAEMDYFDGNSYWFNDWPENWKWTERDDPCSESYYISERFPTRNILASNIGIIAKSADNLKFSVTVTDLITANPIGGAQVEFFNFQQQKIGEILTNSNGMAEISLENTPYLISASYNKQRTWLRSDNGTSLSLSNFDVAGRETQKGIKGFIYGERGVWRPGDTLFLTFVMDDVLNKLPKNHPVLFELFDAKGTLVQKQIKNEGVDNFYIFKLPTKPEAPTGNWRAKVSVGGAEFEQRIKVENVKPNRLKMELSFIDEVLFSRNADQSGILKSSWLHGSPAAGLKAQVNLKLISTNFIFKGFEKYTFTDPTKSYFPTEKILFEGALDAKGEANVEIKQETNPWAPGMLKAIFTTRVFERGGDFSTDVFEMPFSPFQTFTGLQISGATDRFSALETDEDHTISVATLEYSGKPVSFQNLELRIYKLSWRWWWGADSDNLAGWVSGQGSELIEQRNFSTVNGKAQLQFRVDYPDWGQYFIQVLDPAAGGHSSGMIVFLDWPSSYSRSNRQSPSAATMLSFSADKEKYATGDKAKITFPGSDGSRAFISLETGNKILKQWWFDCKNNENSFDITIDAEMAPNFYVYITLIQPHNRTANDLPMRMYGVIPVMVEDPLTVLSPVITTPESIRPESSYQIKISEKNKRAMTYTLAIVDEGLLGLTRFKTPNPWQTFYAREALGVKTWDMFDDVLGAYSGQLQKILAIGGDDELARAGERKANRFKPVVTYAGPFTLKAGQEGVHELAMPNYIGEVRVMVIAGKDGAWGAADKKVPVKQPLMILPSLPRTLSPGEEVSLPVSVFATDKAIRNVTLTVKTDGPLKPSGSATQQINFSETGEKMAWFNLVAGETAGVGKIMVEAGSGSETATTTLEINIQQPNPYTTVSENHIIPEGATQTINIPAPGIKGTNTSMVTVSGLPSFDLEKSLQYLIQYPYGCLEQVVSAGFAQLSLIDIIQLSSDQKAKTDRNIRAAIRSLQAFRMGGGQLSYWPGSNHVSDWSSVYAGHFLLMGEQKGYLIPTDLKNSLLEEQSRQALHFDLSKNPANLSALHTQAYRLYMLALAGKPVFSAMNRLREITGLTKEAAWRLAAAYTLAGRPEVAEKLAEQAANLKNHSLDETDETFGSSLRDQSLILETLVLMNRKQAAFDLLSGMAAEYHAESASTQTTAFCIYALARYAKSTGSSNQLKFSITANGNRENIISEQPTVNFDLDKTTGGYITIENSGKGDLFACLTTIGQPGYGEEKTTTSHLTMQVKYLTVDGKTLDINSIKQGIDFTAEISVTNPGVMGNYRNLALSFSVPSGWEILNKRINDVPDVIAESTYQYRDIRDNRVDTFFDLAAGETATYRIELNASYSGRFYLPAVKCEAMYDRGVSAIEKGRWVEVSK